MNTGYKKIKWLFGKEIEIPEEWKKTTLSKNCINKAKYGASVSAREKDLKLPRYIRITDLNDNGTLRYSEWKSISEEEAKDYILSEGDILFARTGATVGKTYLHQRSDKIYAFAGYLIRFKPDNKNLNSKFLFYLTHSKFYWPWVLSIQTQGVQPNINAEQYSTMSILLPSINEQQKIASILSRVDALIQNTQQVVDKAERLKKGLMQELLIKGIGHTKFKKIKWLFCTKIEIPEGWKLKKIKDLAQISVGLVINPSTYFDDNGTVPMITGKNVTEKGIILDNVDFISENSNKLLETTRIRSGDLVTMRVGYPGRTSLVKNEHDGINCASVIITRRNKKYLSQFLCYLANSKLISKQIIKYQAGGVQQVVNISSWKEFLIPLPTIPEQQKIASILSGVDAYIQKNQEYKKNLELLKKGLMQKLLTGKIRVKV